MILFLANLDSTTPISCKDNTVSAVFLRLPSLGSELLTDYNFNKIWVIFAAVSTLSQSLYILSPEKKRLSSCCLDFFVFGCGRRFTVDCSSRVRSTHNLM